MSQSGASRGTLFELPDPTASSYQPTASSGSLNDGTEPGEIPRDSLLPRWLRVNGTFLLVPDALGVFEALPEREQRALKTLAVTGCLPLVHERQLVGWVALIDDRATATSFGVAMTHAPSWAARLYDVKALALAHARAETIARTNRLSVTGELAADIAHEVRNPLAAIRSTAQMMKDGEAPAGDHERLLETVIAEVDRASLVLQDMLTLGRPRTIRDEECDVRAVAEHAASFCAPYATQSGQRIDVSGVEHLPVLGDFYQLRQVLVNLLLNACQASPLGARVHMEVFTDTDRSGQPSGGVRVSDSGAGIPDAQLPHVFDRFYTTKVNGGGLGLAICRETIDRHGGRMSLTSRVGTGTTVTIHLPLTSAYGPHPHR